MKISPVKIAYKPSEICKTKSPNSAMTFSVAPEEKEPSFISAQTYRAKYLAPVNINFTGAQRTTSKFELKDIYGIDCPCCGNKMMTTSQSKKLVSKTKDSKGPILQRHLSKGFDFYRPTEKKIVKEIIETSKQFPEKNLKELVQYKAGESKHALEERQIEILKKMYEITAQLDAGRCKIANEIIENTIQDIKNSTDEKHFKRGDFLAQMAALEHEKGDEVYETIMNQAAKLPTTHDDMNAFFVKYSRKSGEEIAQRLFSPSTVTTEHVVPKSKGGPDSTENYIPLCGTCNSARGNMSYNEWFKRHPEMPKNLQKYLDTIARVIEIGEFQGADAYEDYVDEVIESVKTATDGKLILKKPDIIHEDIRENIPTEEEGKKELTFEEKCELLFEEYNRLNERLQVLRTIRDSLIGDEEYERICQYVSISQKVALLRSQMDTKKLELNQIGRSLTATFASLRKAIEEGDKRQMRELEERIALKQQSETNINAEIEDILAKLNEAETLLKKAEIGIILPGELQKEISSIEKKLQKRQKLKASIALLSQYEDKYKKILQEIEEITQEIESRTIANEAKKGTIDFDSEFNIYMLKEYEDLKIKLKIISEVDKYKFLHAFDSAEISPEFILEYSKEQILSDIKNCVSSSDAVAYKYEQDKIQERQEDIAKLKEALIPYKEKMRRKKAMEEELKGIFAEYKNNSEVIEKLEELKERKKGLEFKFANVDIEQQIKELKIKTDEALMRYTSAFEEHDYRQESIDRLHEKESGKDKDTPKKAVTNTEESSE